MMQRAIQVTLMSVLLLIVSGIFAPPILSQDNVTPDVPTATLTETETASATETATATETPTETPTVTLTPTDLPLETATVLETLTPSPSASASGRGETETSTASPDFGTPTATTTSTATASATAPAFGAEPQLMPLFTDNFDTGALYLWTLGAGWALARSENGQALTTTTDEPVTFVHNTLLDAAVQARFQFTQGMVRLSLRQSEAGAYTAVLNADGNIALYRGSQPMASAVVSPNQPEQWRTIRLSAIGDVVRVSIDAVEVIAVQDLTPLPLGTISFASVSTSGILVDDVEGWGTSSNKPFESEASSNHLENANAQADFSTNLALQFSDNFDSAGLGWALPEGWSPNAINNNPILILTTGFSPARPLPSYSASNVAAEIRFQIISGKVHLTSRDNPSGGYTASVASDGTVALYRLNDLVASTTIPNFTVATWHVLHLSSIDSLIEVIVDGNLLLSYTDTLPLIAGEVAINGQDLNGLVLYIDDFSLWVDESELQPLTTFGLQTVPPNLALSSPPIVQAQTSGSDLVVYQHANFPVDTTSDIYSIDGNGNNSTNWTATYNNVAVSPSLSPDGNWIIFVGREPNPQNPTGIELYSIKAINIPSNSTVFNLYTFPPNINIGSLTWKPDNTKIAFTTNLNSTGSAYNVWQADFNSSNPLTNLINITQNAGASVSYSLPDWGANGIIYVEKLSTNGRSIKVYPPNSQFVAPSLQPVFNVWGLAWSPDGNKVAYSVEEHPPQYSQTTVNIHYFSTNNGQNNVVTQTYASTTAEVIRDTRLDWAIDTNGNNWLFFERFIGQDASSTIRRILINGQNLSAPLGVGLQNYVPSVSNSITVSAGTCSTLADYGVEAVGFTSTQEQTLLEGVSKTAQALTLHVGGGNPCNNFKNIMMNINGGQTKIRFVYSATGSGCITNNEVDLPLQSEITCTTFTVYTIVHELGHVFVGRTGAYTTGQGTFYGRMNQPVDQVCRNPDNTAKIGAIFDESCSGIVFGLFSGGVAGGDEWVRGERGWGSQSSPLPNPSPFQQNPYSVVDAQSSDEDRQAEIDEAAADMFLNWVYSKLGQGGFQNTSWRVADNCNTTGCPDPANSGTARFNWMNTTMTELINSLL